MAKGQFTVGDPAVSYMPRLREGVAVRLRLPRGKVVSVTAFDPDEAGPVRVAYRQNAGTLEFVLPPVRIYKVVQVRLSGTVPAPTAAGLFGESSRISSLTRSQ